MLNIEKYKEEILRYSGYRHSLVCLIYENIIKKNDCTGCCSKCKRETIEWLTSEYKESILTDEEKVIVKDIINALKPFNLKFTHITKNGFSPEKKEYLSLIYNKDDKYIWVELPKFKRGEKFVGMELGKAYTLEDLGL